MSDEEYTSFLVSTKAVLYSTDLKSVLVMKYSHGKYGLPGGHLEADETPDQAVARELVEELGITNQHLTRTDFFLHDGVDGTIILAYIGIATDDMQVAPTQPDKEYGEWVSRDDIASIGISDAYLKCIIENWPSIAITA